MVAGASGNHPTNVGTAVWFGARTAVPAVVGGALGRPLLGVVQTIAAHAGVVSRNDLQSLTVKRYGPRVAALLMVSVVVNVITIAAGIQAEAAGRRGAS